MENNSSFYQQIVGEKVTHLFIDDESITLIMMNKKLVVYNKYLLEDCGNVYPTFVSKVDFDENIFTIILENNCSVIVYVDDDSFNGPEAMILYIKDKPAIIWS